MKSNIKILESRGYIDRENFNLSQYIDEESIKLLLSSEIPVERTQAAIYIDEKHLNNLIPQLLNSLEMETKLYCKIEISQTISNLGEDHLVDLISRLGTIRKNQHRHLPEKPFLKRSYPLPRDIISRILIRMGEAAISELTKCMAEDSLSREQSLEAIDALGHLSFNHRNDTAGSVLLDLYNKSQKDQLMMWKLIRSFSAFNNPDIKDKLNQIILNSNIKAHIQEAKRSLKILNSNSQEN